MQYSHIYNIHIFLSVVIEKSYFVIHYCIILCINRNDENSHCVEIINILFIDDTHIAVALSFPWYSYALSLSKIYIFDETIFLRIFRLFLIFRHNSY